MLSGALMERFDIYLFAPSMSWQEERSSERSEAIYQRVYEAAWIIQIKRQGKQNAQLSFK